MALSIKCLDDIIRLHRDRVSVRLASRDELAPFFSVSDSDNDLGYSRIDDWRIICLDIHDSEKKFFIVGHNAFEKCVWGTSEIKSLDFAAGLAFTANSTYQLGSAGDGEPPLPVLLHICHLFHTWGFGSSLGVPQVFY
ncbi:MAG: hypothetical protein HY306_00585 [Nitrosomonadales bacterium]|nr:hypothetical protein [Nitrosomonadales bacterium]